MSLAVGYESYVAYGMQTAWNTPITPTITAAHMRTGPVFRPRNSQQPRVTTIQVMPRASQLWDTMDLVDFSLRFEYIANDTAFLPLLTSAFGKRIKTGASAPFTHEYILVNPPVDPSTADAGGSFYNRALTIRHTLTGVATYLVQDCCIDQFSLIMEANAPLFFECSGVGQNLASSSPVSFSDVTGTVLTWAHAIKGTNSGIYVGATNPPALNGTEYMVLKRSTFTLNNNLRFEPFLGAASGQELKKPHRNGFPTAQTSFEGDFEDEASVTDAVQILTDYIGSVEKNFRAVYYLDANNSLEMLVSGSTKPGVIDSPQINVGNEGVVGFTFNLNHYPDTMDGTTSSNMKLIQKTGT